MIQRVVLDTNVIISALLKPQGLEDRVLRLSLTGKLRLYTSPAILAEYASVLPRSRFKLEAQEVRQILQSLRQVSILVHPFHTLEIASHEPDNRFLECAQEATADFLVTGNKRHFPKHWKTTVIVNAREFLKIFISDLGSGK